MTFFCGKIILILGATASGKSAAAHQMFHRIVEHFGVRPVLVNLDAFQFYRGFDIGTAKPTKVEQEVYNYNGLDLLEPTETLDASSYVSLVDSLIAGAGVTICVGGSGLYTRAFLHGLDAMPAREESLRQFLRGIADHWGWAKIHHWLLQVDPARAQALHPNDGVRIERALECFLMTGLPASSHHTNIDVTLNNQDLRRNMLVLHTYSEDLRSKIETRVHQMLDSDWVGEVRNLFHTSGFSSEDFCKIPAMRAIGYLQIHQYLQSGSKGSLTELQTIIAQKTWQYAKRQQTWNRKEVNHGSPDDWDLVMRYLTQD